MTSEQTVQLPLRRDGTLRVGVVADTHSLPNPSGVKHLAALEPDVILHAGDIGDLECLNAFRKIAPTYGVRGNIDEKTAELPDHLKVELTRADKTVFRLMLLHIAVAGPRLRADAFRAAKASGASLVVCGHSHVPFLGRDRGLILFNPGSIGPKRFALPILFGMIDVTPQGVTIHHHDCATGARWEPLNDRR
ncbi:MAG: metallophosphoesterase family protein [Myxococcaceae bacterium]